jgi:GT2 family glycosyltransferase
MNRVCAVVVSYNRKDLLRICLKALQSQTRQLDCILVVDNASNDGTVDMLVSEFPSIEVMALENNTGGAGGFYAGMRKAHENGYDMFWLMDDDSEPHPDALELLLAEPLTSRDDIVCVCGRVLNRQGNIVAACRGYFNDFDKIIATSVQRPVPEELYNEAVIEIDTFSFVGPLIKRGAVDRIGYPMKEFFIHHDDVEYSIRLRKIGKIVLIGSSAISHFGAATQSDGNGSSPSEVPSYTGLWIRYYGKRNLCYIAKREAQNRGKFALSFIRCLLQQFRESIRVLLYADHKFRRIALPWLAMYHGLSANFDNDIPRRWLYKTSK